MIIVVQNWKYTQRLSDVYCKGKYFYGVNLKKIKNVSFIFYSDIS